MEAKLFRTFPTDVEEQTSLTPAVAQGILSSLESPRSSIHFEEEIVYIELEYGDRHSKHKGEIRVFPERAVIVHSKDPFQVPEKRGDCEPPAPRRGRQVRWIVRNLAPTDRVVIRAKRNTPQFVFNYLGGSALEIAAPHNSISSGLPFLPHFHELAEHVELDGRKRAVVVWRYDVEVYRGAKLLFSRDPEIYVEGEYQHTI